MLTAPGGRVTLGDPLTERRRALEAFLAEAGPNPTIKLSPFTRDRNEALRWLEGAGGEMDGVIAKRADGPYVSGERAMLKIKRTRTADCVVGGFRYGTGSPDMGSLLLGLFNAEGQLDHVGHCSSFSVAERHELTVKLEALRGEPGFTGRSPGGPSRWSTERTGEFESLRHELVVEVSYDHMSGGRFRHGTSFIRWRPDKAPGQCRFDQLEQVVAPEFLRT
jgi:ATP-dependent DNA ligase